MLLVQRLVTLLASRLTAWLLRWLGQSPVVGEMIAALAPGPLMFGALILPMLLYFIRRQPAAIKRSTSSVHD